MKNNPYIGPRPFERQHRDRFFGREREARELQSLIIAEREVLFYAQSGAGKSSLLNARVIPGLEEEGYTVLPVARVGSELPPGVAPAAVANIFVFSTLLSLAGAAADPQALAQQTLGDWLRGPCEDKLPILIFDQFEELFTTHRERWQEAEDFFRQVRQALDELPNLGVVFAMREDYLAAVDSYVQFFARRLRARFRMELLGVSGALAAVQRPAQNAGCPFAAGVAERLVDNLRQVKVQAQGGRAESGVLGPYVEPVQLQVVCSRLWENLPEAAPGSETIEWAEVEQYGDIDRALTDFYESAVAAVAAERPTLTEAGWGLTERRVRRWFGEQLITTMGTRGLVMRGPEETAGLPNAAVEALEAEHIIRADQRAGARWYELSHDRFVDPILKANQDWQLRQGPLMQAAQAWETSGRHKSKLYRGQQLEDALSGLERNTLDPLIQEFLAVSQEENLAAQAEARRKAEEERALEAEAQAKQQAGAARRRIIMMGVMTLLAIFVMIISYWSNTQAAGQIHKVDVARVPAALAASRAQADLLRMLSDVRGYLALGDSIYRTSYQHSAQAFEADLAQLEALSPLLSANGQAQVNELSGIYQNWAPLPVELFYLRDDQLMREPAYKILVTDGTTYAGTVLIDTDSMMDQEAQGEASAEGKWRLQDMAAFNDSFAAMNSALHAYVTTRNSIYKSELEVNRANNEYHWHMLNSLLRSELTADQQGLLDEIGTNRADYLDLVEQIYAVLESDHWREDYYLFTNETVPLADEMSQILDAFVTSEQIGLATDLAVGRRALDLANQFILGGGLITLLLGLGMIWIETMRPDAKARWAALVKNRFVLASAGVATLLVALVLIAPRLGLPSQPVAETVVPTLASPTESWGLGDTLRIIHPQAPTILNPHLSRNVKDLEPSRITYEPLASYDKDGQLIPFLAAEIPSLANGGVASNGLSATWKLKHGVRWSDGEPFTADDVVFTFEYVTDPDVGAATAHWYATIASVEAVDDYTVKINFTNPTPAWDVPFVGIHGMILPRHVFEAYKGKNALEAPANILPVGTGPYRVVAPGIEPREVANFEVFLMQTVRIVFEPNPYFREPDKLFFSRVEYKGGDLTDQAAQLVVQDGRADLAYALDSLDPDRLASLAKDGKGYTELSRVLVSCALTIDFLSQ